MRMPVAKLCVYKVLLEENRFITGYEITKQVPYQHQGIYRILSDAYEKGALKLKVIEQSSKPNRKAYKVIKPALLKKMIIEELGETVNIPTLGIIQIDLILGLESLIEWEHIEKWLTDIKYLLIDHMKDPYVTNVTIANMLSKEIDKILRRKQKEITKVA